MRWKPKIVAGVVYDLSHLHPGSITITWPAKGALPEKTIVVFVEYSMHCFTADVSIDHPNYDVALQYKDSREIRQFHFERYEHSKVLPELIQNISSKLCYGTPHRNYFILLPHPDGVSHDLKLVVYFSLGKHGGNGADLTMYIESAHCKPKPKLGRTKGCSFKELCGKVI